LFLGAGVALDFSEEPLDLQHVVDQEYEGLFESGMAFAEEGGPVFLDVLHRAGAEAMHGAAR
jgi:hypothetical protein